MAERLSALGLSLVSNPLGVVYNPVSIADQIERLVEGKLLSPAEFIIEQDSVYDWQASHKLARPTSEQYLEDTNSKIRHAHDYLQTADAVIITLASAWVYALRSDGRIVANCHKKSGDFFDKKLLTSQQITESLQRIQSALDTLPSSPQVIWTISPVRYIRDGLRESQHSKSLLFAALHEHLSHRYIDYFPSYEILIDCLRDYRFHARDMVHPSTQAVDIIYDYLMDQWLDPADAELYDSLLRYQSWRMHRTINASKDPPKKILDLLDTIKQDLPDWSPKDIK